MDLKNDDEEMKRFLKVQFGECSPLVKLIQATPPHQIHRRRIEVRLGMVCVGWRFDLKRTC